MKLVNCCICGSKVEGFGNNPYGAMWKDTNGNICEPTFNQDARCCNDCNSHYVIPGRLYRLTKRVSNK